MIVTVKGKVFSGHGEGKKFTELPWVRKEIRERLGFEPYPGTLNLSLSSDIKIGNLLSKSGGWLIQAKKGFKEGRLYRALVLGKVPGGVMRPIVPNYPENVIEVVAPIFLREELGLRDDDEIEVQIWLE